MSDFFDDLETRGAEERATDQYARLRAQLAHARTATSYYGKLLGDADPDAVAGPEEFARLPLTRKADLIERQQVEPPFGVRGHTLHLIARHRRRGRVGAMGGIGHQNCCARSAM